MTNLGFRTIEPMFEDSYEGKPGDGVVDDTKVNPVTGKIEKQGMHRCFVFPVKDDGTGQRYKVSGNFAWKLTLDVTINSEDVDFNDFGSSFVACFALTMINNLQIIAKSLSYNPDGSDNKMLKCYFAVFYLISTIMIINIFQTLILEMYLVLNAKKIFKRKKKKSKHYIKKIQNKNESNNSSEIISQTDVDSDEDESERKDFEYEYAEENGVCKNSKQPLRKSAFCSCKKNNVLKNIGSDKPQKEFQTNIFRHKFRKTPDDSLKDNPDTPDEKCCFFTVLQI
jgi:hypothetical protein